MVKMDLTKTDHIEETPQSLTHLAELLCLAGVWLEFGRDDEENQKQLAFFGKPESKARLEIQGHIIKSSIGECGGSDIMWSAPTRHGQMIWTGLCDPEFLRDVVLKQVLLQHKNDRYNHFSFN